MCTRSAPEQPSVRRASLAGSTPSIGRSCEASRRIASRAGRSGGSTSTVRSSRPGRRSAVSTSHGWFVAASTNTPSLSACAPSSSASSWLTTLRPPEWRRWLRFWPSASSSSRKSTQGAARRAASNASCSRRSDSPSHMSSTSLRPSEKNARAELAGDRAREERLAAAGRAVQQQAAAQRLAVVRAQLGVAQRREEGGVQARLDLLQAADVGERDPRAVGLDQALGVQLREAFGDRDRLLRSRPPPSAGRSPAGLVRLSGGGVVPSKPRRMRAYQSARAVSPSARAASRAATSASASSGAVCSAACACSSARPASPPMTSSDARCTRNAGLCGSATIAASRAAVTDGSTDTRWGYPETCPASLAIGCTSPHTGFHVVVAALLFVGSPSLGRRTRARRGLPPRELARRPAHPRRAR